MIVPYLGLFIISLPVLAGSSCQTVADDCTFSAWKVLLNPARGSLLPFVCVCVFCVSVNKISQKMLN